MNILTWPTLTIDLRPNYGPLVGFSYLHQKRGKKYNESFLSSFKWKIYPNIRSILLRFAKNTVLNKNKFNRKFLTKETKGQIRANASDPSSNNNLNERSLCIQNILYFPFIEIYYLSKFFLLQLQKNSNYSIIEFSKSIGEWISLLIGFNNSQIECFKKDFEMRTNIYKNNSKSVRSKTSKLNLTRSRFIRMGQIDSQKWALMVSLESIQPLSTISLREVFSYFDRVKEKTRRAKE